MPDYLSFEIENARMLAASANPVAPEERSMLSSSKSQRYSSSEKPYRVGQLFARPPSVICMRIRTYLVIYDTLNVFFEIMLFGVTWSE